MASRKPRPRPHGHLPAGFTWRDGRPRWVPSPSRRRQGWKGLDLKDAWGQWLAKGAAIQRCEDLARAIAAWAAGEPVPAAFAAIAPAAARQAPTPAGSPRAIGLLLDAYYASEPFKRLADKTQSDYRSKLKRFLGAVAGGDSPAKLASVRAQPIDALLPPGFDEPGEFELELAYEALRQNAGEAMAHGVMACVSAWLAWCVKKRRVWPSNPAALVERATPDGRIVTLSWPEIVALVRTADARGLKSIGDAVILAADLSWSPQDLLAIRRSQVSQDLKIKHRRIKTGVAGNPPLLAVGRRRVEQIYARWAAETVQPLHLIVCELTGQPWNAHTFRHEFARIRAAAAFFADLPALNDKQFRDLRDTAVTWGHDAGLTLEEICSRTLHVPSRAQKVLEKHYGYIGQALTDSAARKLDAHFAAQGYAFD